MTTKAAVMGLCVLLAGCALTPANSNVSDGSLVPSEILAHREKYDGQIVLVRGYLSIEPDSICLIDPEHSGDADPPVESLFSILGLERVKPDFERFNGKVVVLSARFKTKVAKENQFLLNGCGRPGVQIESDQMPLVVK